LSDKNSNENQDTLKFKVPTREELTRIYSASDKEVARMNADRKNPSVRSENQTAKTSSETTHKKHRGKSGQSRPVQQQPVKKSPPKRYAAPPSKPSSPSPAVKPSYVKPSSAEEFTSVRVARGRKKKSSFTFGTFVRILIIILVLLFVIYSSAALFYISKINSIENTGQYVNNPETMLYSSDIKNILIIGEDARETSARGLSDSMILLSVNQKKHRLQMTSFMRDMYTEIDGYDYDKLNAAYSYGGAELLRDTIEDNFKIRIDGCVTVNFVAVSHIVDAMGGVDITMSADEANAINEILYNEVNEIMGDDDPYDDFLPVADGSYHLNGKQALSYSRIRYVGDADFERTQRQRTVITQLISRIKKIKPAQFNSYMQKALGNVSSDMSVAEMYLLSLRLPFLLSGYETEQLRIPADDTWYFDETWDGMSIITVDFYANTEYLKNKIYLKDENE